MIFSNHEKAIEVYNRTEEYLEKHQEMKKDITTLIWVYHDLGDLVPQPIEKFWSGHYFPYTESFFELQNSFLLAQYGFYRYAFISLRIVLELGLLSVYWDKNDKAHQDIQNWLKSMENTPFKSQLCRGLQKIENIRIFDKKTSFIDRIEKLYDELSNYVHTKGSMYSSSGMNISNFNAFNSEVLEGWHFFMSEIIKINCIAHLLKYPVGLQYTPIEQKYGINGPMGGFLKPFQLERMKNIFDKKTYKILKEISDDDENAVGLTEAINDLPDITREKLDKQILDFDKRLIEQQGWNPWYKFEMQDYEFIKENDPEGCKKFMKRIKKLESWAKEKGYIEPKYKRINSEKKQRD